MRFARIRLAIHKLQGRRSGSKDKNSQLATNRAGEFANCSD